MLKKMTVLMLGLCLLGVTAVDAQSWFGHRDDRGYVSDGYSGRRGYGYGLRRDDNWNNRRTFDYLEDDGYSYGRRYDNRPGPRRSTLGRIGDAISGY